MGAVRALLSGAIDYAGLFPPASLDLERTAANFEHYQASDQAWALGRLVLPATRLAEFADRWPERVHDWPISLLLGSDFDTEMRLAVDAGLPLHCIECRPQSLHDVDAICRRMPEDALLFVESPSGVRPEDLLSAVMDAGACAKLRTGGTTADAIPTTRIVAEFLAACARRGVRMKATAGLHHAMRGDYRLTYAADSDSAPMHGFVNFYVAAAAALSDADAEEIERILDDSDPANFRASDDAITWRTRSLSADDLHRTRQRLAISMGSCSFDEPIEDLHAMGWIE